MPGALPFFGHLHLHAGASGMNDARLWTHWGKILSTDLLQVKFGQKRVVIANSWDAVREIFVKNVNKTTGRPRQYIFEKYIGYDLGTHSLDENFKAQRLAGIQAIQARKWIGFYPGLERKGSRLILNLAEQEKYGEEAINPSKLMQIVVMNLAFRITFDKHFDSAKDPWLREYIDNARLLQMRGASNTYSDFIPMLRFHPKYRIMGEEGRRASKKRSEMIRVGLEDLNGRIEKGENPQCIAASVLTGEGSLSIAQGIRCSISMLQGGTESLPSHIFAGMGGLISSEGIEIQEKAYQPILDAYPNGDAAEYAFQEEKVPYIVAISKEILRNYTVLPFGLPHEATEDIHLRSGVIIPKGTRLYMNSEGGNHDEARFGPSVGEFNPESWLNNKALNEGGMPHLAFGVGSRQCPAFNILNLIIYGLLLQTILNFQLRADDADPPPKSWETFGAAPSGIFNEPKGFRVRFVPRDVVKLRDEVERIKSTGVRC